MATSPPDPEANVKGFGCRPRAEDARHALAAGVRNPSQYLGHVGRGMAGTGELACRHRAGRLQSGKQPALWLRRLVPGAQQLQQMRRQHHVAVFMALALFDPDHHALAVDVGHLQRHHFGHAQSGAISHAQRRLVLDPRRCIEEARNLLRTEDNRQLAGLVDKLRVVYDVAAPERDPEKEPQRRGALVQRRHAGTGRGEMQLIAAHVLEARGIGRAAEERSEVLDPLHVVALSLRRELADRHVFDHALAQRAHCLVGHGDAPV